MRIASCSTASILALALVALGCGAGGGSGAAIPTSALSAPVVDGELSAGHTEPVWAWAGPAGATAYRCRIDGGPWVETGTASTTHAADGLEPGDHTFEVQARDGDGLWTGSGSFTTTVEVLGRPGCWEGVARALATTPLGHICAVNYHNCYVDDTSAAPADNLTDTLNLIHAAQAADVDCVELDVHVDAGLWYVAHDAGLNYPAFAARLESVLQDPALQAGDQLLFLELKPTSVARDDIAALLTLLADNGYAVNGRPVVIRSFYERDGGQHALDLLGDATFLPFHRHYFWVFALCKHGDSGDSPATAGAIAAVAAAGYAGVEIQTASTWTKNLFALTRLAQGLGLCTGQWTIKDSSPATYGSGEVWVHAFREELDVITTDYDPGAAVQDVEEDSTLLYMNVWDQPSGVESVAWFRGTTPDTIGVGGVAEPALVTRSPLEDMTGRALQFDASQTEALVFHDADVPAGDGYFASALVNLTRTGLAPSTTHVLVGKADGGAFSLELRSDGSGEAETLRFGVFVDDPVLGADYYYASANVGALGINGTDSYLVVGAYNGSGRVGLYVNGRLAAESTEVITGGVVPNDSPVVVGGDPDGPGGVRFHFDGMIQMVSVQRWR